MQLLCNTMPAVIININSLRDGSNQKGHSCESFLKVYGHTYKELWRSLLSNCTLKCLSIGTPKAINFPFVSNEKLMFFSCPNIQAHCNEAVLCLNFGTPENNEFSIWNKWKIYYF